MHDEYGDGLPDPVSKRVLLPSDVRPSHYKAVITPNFEDFTFMGKVSVDLTVDKPVKEVTFHAADMKIESVVLWADLGRRDIGYTPTEIRMDAESETVTLVFAEDLPAGSASLNIYFSGILNDKMCGFYRSKYTGADGKERHLATTQFEPTDARRALPCWDEPSAKATFDITLIVPEAMTALSNMPVWSVSRDETAGLKTVRFERTPKMSTYLLALIVGDLEFVEASTKEGTLIRVYTVPGKKEQGRFALETAVKVLELYNEYFDTPYPLPKLDMAAIPDFAAGAMENWGMVTYRENAVLVDPANSSAAAYQRVAEVVSHELAHMWFGNLVTMAWWTNLWLNEGFATWVASFAMATLFPEWDIWTQFVSDEYASALSLDGLRSSHPIEVEVGHPNQITQIFDAISYSKGASVIRMIHDYIGPTAFRDGLRVYLKRFAYGNAVTEDLWQALSEASGQPVNRIMDTWTKQMGYPLITLSPSGTTGSYLLKQERFLAGGNELTAEESAQLWSIPLAYAVRDNVLDTSDGAKTIVSVREGSFAAPDHSTLKLNYGQVALARVNYTDAQWQALALAIRNGQLFPTDRYGLLSDALALARAGKFKTSLLLDLLSAYKNEENYTVWTIVLGALGAVSNVLEGTPDERRFDLFARNLLAGIADKLGWQQPEGSEEPHTTKLLRGQVLGSYGAYGDGGTVARAVARFHDLVSCGKTIDPNLRAVVYSLIAKYGDCVEFNNLVRMYENETLQEEKVRFLNALGRFTEPNVLADVLDYAFNSGKVRPGDFFYVLAGLSASSSGRRFAWNFLKTNWSQVTERFTGGGLKMLSRIISMACDGFARAEDADDVEQFFKANPVPSATRAIAESLERIRVRAAWYERDKAEISSALPEVRASGLHNVV